MSELDKIARGAWYDAESDTELMALRLVSADLCFELNRTKPSDIEERLAILTKLLGRAPEDLDLMSPFACEYGTNITFGRHVRVGANTYFMDCARITVGDHTCICPGCGLYTVNRPLDKESRRQGLAQALPITIGKDCWLGANVTVLPGVTIGDGTVIGAGSIVTRDIPAGVLAVGTPCQVIKKF